MPSIAIIGMGPRGASLLERIVTHTIKAGANSEVEIFLFEKEKEFGPGCHYTSLPKDLLTNTIAGQMTMYFGDEMKDHGPVHNGDCLYDWHRKARNPDTKITDYLTRRDLGEYLHEFFLKQIARMQEHNIRFHQVGAEVDDIIHHQGCVEVHTVKSKYLLSQAVLCIGHQASDGKHSDGYDSFLNYEALEDIKAGEEVGIQGMGLTACDVISRFTEGRGGKYEKVDDTRVRYIPSGQEPKLNLFSRTGVFLAGRAYNPDHNYIYSPKFFTKDAIEKLRKEKGQLDFDNDVLPLLKQELEHAYSLKDKDGTLDLDLFFNPEKRISTQSQEAFHHSFTSYLRWDIEQCAIGKVESAYKFCQDAIRDLRDQFRAMIDFQGLNTQSYQRFFSYWQAKFLKICVGPPYIRLMQIEALIEAGICTIDFAYNPQIEEINGKYHLTCQFEEGAQSKVIDHIVKARTPSINMVDTPNPLTINLLQRYKPFMVGARKYGGLDVNKDYEVFNANGMACHNLHAFGIPSEGAKYFTLVLGRPNMVSTFLLDSNNLAASLLGKLLQTTAPVKAAE